MSAITPHGNSEPAGRQSGGTQHAERRDHTQTKQLTRGTRIPAEAGNARTSEAVHAVRARATVQARRARALIDVCDLNPRHKMTEKTSDKTNTALPKVRRTERKKEKKKENKKKKKTLIVISLIYQ